MFDPPQRGQGIKDTGRHAADALNDREGDNESYNVLGELGLD
jgi:hypothetical protein